jgi:general secretion pathway protein D
MVLSEFTLMSASRLTSHRTPLRNSLPVAALYLAGLALPVTFLGQAAPDAGSATKPAVAPAAPAAAATPAAPTIVTGTVAAVPIPSLAGSDKVGPLVLRDETISQVLELLQRWTGKSVLRPQALPANLYTLSLPANITRDDALLALETLLSLNGISVIQQGDKFLKVVPNQAAKGEAPTLIMESTLTMAPSGRVASKIFVLKHANGQEIVQPVTGMLNSTLANPPVYFSRNNAVLVTDSITNLQKIESLLLQLDRPQLDYITTKIYALKNATAADTVTKLTALLRTPATQGAAPFRLSTGTSFTADERTNRVIIMGSPEQHDFFDKLINQLDADSDPNTKTDVVFLRHAVATDVATLLTQLITGQTTAATRTGNTATRNGTNRALGATGAAGAAAGGAAGGAAAGGAAGANAANGANQNGADEFSGTVTVIPDARSNSVVVSGTKSDLRLLHELIDKIDVVLPQVRIEVVVAEVTLEDQDTSGINALGLTLNGGKLVGVSSTYAGGTLTSNGTAGTAATIDVNGNLSGIIGLSTTPTKSDTRILSVPSITTTHNKEATVFVGESVPVITGTTASTVTPGTTTSTVTQRDIGITLKVLPLIGKDGAVQLQVSAMVEDILGQVQIDGNNQPIIGRRETDSYVTAMSGEIVVLGGLQRRNKITTESRLGPFAFIGNWLGGSTSDDTRTEIVVFLRPYVLNNEAVDNLDSLNRIRSTPIGDETINIVQRPLPAYNPDGKKSPLSNGVPATSTPFNSVLDSTKDDANKSAPKK